MSSERPTLSEGLRGVEVLESQLTAITPEGLFLRGVALDQLLSQATFEELAFWLWHGSVPTAEQLTALRRTIARAWLLPEAVSELVSGLTGIAPLSALQVALPLLGEAFGAEQPLEQAALLLGQVPAVLATQRAGVPPPPLDIRQPLAPQLLLALGAAPMLPVQANRALILYADHELPASTFAARVTVAARAGLYDGMQAAVSVLKGPLHGGSLLEAAALLRDLSSEPDLTSAAAALAAREGRIAGFGHSVYRDVDPRATHFRLLAEQIAPDEARRWVDAAALIEAAVLARRGLRANVDLWSAAWMHAAGIADALMPALFAVARTAGWTAHMLEQLSNNRLIRPRARYVGELNRGWPSADTQRING